MVGSHRIIEKGLVLGLVSTALRYPCVNDMVFKFSMCLYCWVQSHLRLEVILVWP